MENFTGMDGVSNQQICPQTKESKTALIIVIITILYSQQVLTGNLFWCAAQFTTFHVR